MRFLAASALSVTIRCANIGAPTRTFVSSPRYSIPLTRSSIIFSSTRRDVNNRLPNAFDACIIRRRTGSFGCYDSKSDSLKMTRICVNFCSKLLSTRRQIVGEMNTSENNITLKMVYIYEKQN